MKLFAGLGFWILIALSAKGQFMKRAAPFSHTFSIVARDSVTGEMAVGVQSHWFSVGTVVAWGEAGVGVVATQSFVDKRYGYLGVEYMRNGLAAHETLAKLLADDSAREVRQVAMIDSRGRVAAYTGKNCIDFAADRQAAGVSVQSNMMLNSAVPAAMLTAYQNSRQPSLARRVLDALKAAQKVGGDIRGEQSAALLVVSGDTNLLPWNGRLVDLRVEDARHPLEELERLLYVHEAYEWMNAGDLAMEKNQTDTALKHYKRAMKMFPDNLEMQYWSAITLANSGKLAEALPILKTVYQRQPIWRELTRRIRKVNLITVNEATYQKLLK